ncbi:MAG: DNA polymerase I [Propionibacteriaceae bacterium]|nr:DNA polymerase I [Propionibacteriaceae bacterium]
MTQPQDKLLLVDGYSLAFRAFYGYPLESFTTSTGQYTNAVYGFATLLLGTIRSEQPTHIGVAFDRSRTTFRTREYSEYKANRGATPPEFLGQVELIKEFLDALNISHIDVDDYEADDIIATWAHQGRLKDMEVLIASGDRDTFQLITDGVTVLYPGRNETQRMTPQAVEDKHGVPPRRYPELAALVGETSDNLPGVPGVGPKTAAKWLKEYDGLENLLRRADQVPGKAGESLRAHIDDVHRNRRLNHLLRDLNLPVDVSELTRGEVDMAAVNQLFDLLQFRALRARVSEIFEVRETEQVVHTTTAIETIEPGTLTSWLTSHASTSGAVDFLGQWGRGNWSVESVGIATGDNVGCVELSTLTQEDAQALAQWLANPDIEKTVHDIKAPLIALWERGWDLAGVTCDTQIAAYLANPDRRNLDLGSLSERYLGRTLTEENADDQPAFNFEVDSASQTAGIHARTIADISVPLNKEISDKGAADLCTQVELPLTRVLASMEYAGIGVDPSQLNNLHQQFDSAVIQAQSSAFEAIGHEINLSSPKQLQVVLFEELGMPKTRKTKSGHTTDAEALDHLLTTTGHPFLTHLMAHRDAIKLRQSVEGLIKATTAKDRIHTTYLQTAAATGRLSSQDPNLQNIPARTSAGNQIRTCFIPGPGYEALLTADYSQIEMRIMAHISGDEYLTAAFNAGQDFHTVMAGRVFGVDPDQVTPDQRSRVKAVNYGLAYGLSSFGLSNQLKITVGEANVLMESFFEHFGSVRDYLQSVVVEARHTGYTETILGRRRYLPDLESTNRTRREMAERMALNAPIQGTAADIIKVAMLELDSALKKAGLTSRMLLQVHDELIFEVGPGESETLEEIVRREMGQAAQLSVPLDVSVGIGPTWAGASHS